MDQITPKFVHLGHQSANMPFIPILDIQQFELNVPMSDFYCNDLRTHLDNNRDFFHKPHRHNFYLCVLFTKGRGIHDIDFQQYQLQRGSLFFLKPGQTHFWKFSELPEGYIFFHTKEFFEIHFSRTRLEQYPFYYTRNSSPILTIEGTEIEKTAKKFVELFKEYNEDMPYKQQKIANLLQVLYIDLSRNYTKFSEGGNISSFAYLETLQKLEKLIEKFYTEEKNAGFYAEKLNITSKHLNRIVKETLGKTTSNLIMERVMLESKRLIIHSEQNLTEIAEILGFLDYTYFSKLFKSKTGATPTEFRKNFS